MRRHSIVVMGAVLLFGGLLAGQAHAANPSDDSPVARSTGNRAHTFSVSPVIGGITFDQSRHLESAPVFGGRVGYNFTKYLGMEALFDYAKTKSTSSSTTADLYRYGAELLLHAWPDRKFVPYLAAGYAGMNLTGSGTSAKNAGVLDFGVGFKYFVTEDMAWRADLRELLDKGIEYSTGIYIPFGGAPGVVKLADPPPAPVARPAVVAPPPVSLLAPPAPVAAAPPVAAAASPAPVAILSAAPTSIAKGQGSILSWASQNAVRCELLPNLGPVQLRGYLTVRPERDTLYTLICAGREGSAKSTATVSIIKPAPPVSPAALAAKKRFCNQPAIIMINFDVDKYNIKPQSHAELKSVGDFLNEFPDSYGEISGHTDGTNTRQYNQKLSERRANAVREYIVTHFGIASERLTSKGYGKDRPIASNKTAAGRAKNRRIEANLVCEPPDAQPTPAAGLTPNVGLTPDAKLAPNAGVTPAAGLTPTSKLTPTAGVEPVATPLPMRGSAPAESFPPQAAAAPLPPRSSAVAPKEGGAPGQPAASFAPRDREALPAYAGAVPVAPKGVAAPDAPPVPFALRKREAVPTYFPSASVPPNDAAAPDAPTLPVAQRKQEAPPDYVNGAPVPTDRVAAPDLPPLSPAAQDQQAAPALPGAEASVTGVAGQDAPPLPVALRKTEAMQVPVSGAPVPGEESASFAPAATVPLLGVAAAPLSSAPLALREQQDVAPLPVDAAPVPVQPVTPVAVLPVPSALLKQEPPPPVVDERPFVLQAEQPRQASEGEIVVTGISIDKNGMSINTRGKVKDFSLITQVQPFSLVVDIFGAVSGLDVSRAPVDKFDLLTVRFREYPDRLQIIIDADQEEIIPYRTIKTDTGLRINIKPRSTHHIGP